MDPWSLFLSRVLISVFRTTFCRRSNGEVFKADRRLKIVSPSAEGSYILCVSKWCCCWKKKKKRKQTNLNVNHHKKKNNKYINKNVNHQIHHLFLNQCHHLTGSINQYHRFSDDARHCNFGFDSIDGCFLDLRLEKNGEWFVRLRLWWWWFVEFSRDDMNWGWCRTKSKVFLSHALNVGYKNFSVGT